MGKVCAAPGISSRPLTRWERLVEWNKRRPSYRWYLYYKHVHAWQHWRYRRQMKALRITVVPPSLMQGEPLQIESLESTMKLVTFDDSHIKLRLR